MGNTIKRIKTIVLLVALSWFWQSSSIALEQAQDIREVETEAGGIKRSAQQEGLFQRESSDCYFKDFPDEVIDRMFHYYNIRQDQNTLLALSSSCTTFHTFAMQKYTEANAAEHHFPWVANPSLNPRTLYILNTRMLTTLGLYVNIKNGWAREDIDYRRFEKLCAQFEECPLFPSTAVPVMYVEFLELDLKCPKPPPFQAAPFVHPLHPEWLEKRVNCVGVLDTIARQGNPICQNERCLYFHFYQFVEPLPSDQLKSRRVDPAFVMLNNSLKTVLNEDLHTLKKTPGLSDGGEFAETWKTIIELEPAATAYQLELAAESCTTAADKEYDLHNLIDATTAEAIDTTMAKAIEYTEELLRIIKAAGLSPTKYDYDNFFWTYSRAGNLMRDPLVQSKNYAKAAKYKKLKASVARKGFTWDIYDTIAHTYLLSGQCAIDPLVRGKRFAKAIKYAERSLGCCRLTANGKFPSGGDYYRIAYLCFTCVENTTNSPVRTMYCQKAIEYFELSLKSGDLIKDHVKQVHFSLIQAYSYAYPNIHDSHKAIHHEIDDEPSRGG